MVKSQRQRTCTAWMRSISVPPLCVLVRLTLLLLPHRHHLNALKAVQSPKPLIQTSGLSVHSHLQPEIPGISNRQNISHLNQRQSQMSSCSRDFPSSTEYHFPYLPTATNIIAGARKQKYGQLKTSGPIICPEALFDGNSETILNSNDTDKPSLSHPGLDRHLGPSTGTGDQAGHCSTLDFPPAIITKCRL